MGARATHNRLNSFQHEGKKIVVHVSPHPTSHLPTLICFDADFLSQSDVSLTSPLKYHSWPPSRNSPTQDALHKDAPLKYETLPASQKAIFSRASARTRKTCLGRGSSAQRTATCKRVKNFASKGAFNADEILELNGFRAESLDASAVEGLVKDLVADAEREFSYETEFWDPPNPLLGKWYFRKQRGVVSSHLHIRNATP